jgi:hypothetical protein
MMARRAARVMLVAFLSLLVHPCLVPAGAAEPHHADETTDLTGCEPEGTTRSTPATPSAEVAVSASATADRDAGRGPASRLDRSPAPPPRAPLYLLHAALLA